MGKLIYFMWVSYSVDVEVRVDSRGRITIPRAFRDKLRIGKVVRLRVSGDALIVEPLQDPLERLRENAEFRFESVEREIRRLRRAAEKQLMRENIVNG